MSKFIPRYEFPRYNIPKTDFKGHQLKALKKFNALRPQLNLILELRDIRAPLSTRNLLIDQLIDERIHQRLVIYTKKDLVEGNEEYLNKLQRWHQEIDEDYILVNCKQRQTVTNVMKCIQLYKKRFESQNNGFPLPTGYKVIVTGMPNVGKSTLVNSLRASGKKVARTGGQAGITRSTSECIKIGNENIYLIDTPGIGLPGRLHTTYNRMLTLSLCGCIKTNLIDPVIQADYLLFLINLQRNTQTHNKPYYPQELTNPTNNVYNVLNRIAKNRATATTNNDISRAVQWLSRPRTGLIYDPEMLLDCENFSLKKYLDTLLPPDKTASTTQPTILGSRDNNRPSSSYDKMLQNVNQLFPRPK